MRVLPLLAVAALLLAGCSSKAPPTATPSPDAAQGDASPGTDGPLFGAGNGTAGSALPAMRFASADQESQLSIKDSFAPTDACFFVAECQAHMVDLAPVVPAGVPVELSISLQIAGNIRADVQGNDAVTFVQYSEEDQGDEVTIDILLVRPADGVVELRLYPDFLPSPYDSPSSGATITGTAHSVSRADVVPAYLPVGVELGPGDVVDAHGDGLSQFVAFPPSGPAIRIQTAPFRITLPSSAPAGMYILFAQADEAVRLGGPNRTLMAHRLSFSHTDPVDVPLDQEVGLDIPAEGFPLEVGVVLTDKDTVPDCCAVAPFQGTTHVKVVSPENVQVLVQDDSCLQVVACHGLSVVSGGNSQWYGTAFLDEHLVKGTYHATVTVETGNGLQAFGYATTIL